MFINKINKLKYYFNLNDKKNTLLTKNEIFNVPYKLELKDFIEEKKIISKIDINFLNLKVINEFNYKNTKKKGLIKFLQNNEKSEGSYIIEKNYFNFNFIDKSLNDNFKYEGKINFIPFFSEIFGDIKKINASKIFNSEAIIVQLFKTQLLNNKNLNIDTIIKAKKIEPFNNLINLLLNFKIKEGLIDINDTKFSWSNNVDFKISDSLLYVKDNNLILDGNIEIEIFNINEIYKFLKSPRNYRKEIEK